MKSLKFLLQNGFILIILILVSCNLQRKINTTNESTVQQIPGLSTPIEPVIQLLPESFIPHKDQFIFLGIPDESNDIFLVNLQTAVIENLTNSSETTKYNINLSPDGQFISFSAKINGNSDIFLMDLSSRKSNNITNSNELDDWCGNWSPDRKYLSIISENMLSITTPKGDTLIKIPLLMDRRFVNGCPIWSPRGDSLIATASSSYSGVKDVLIKINPITGEITILSEIYKLGYSWSPDGSKIVFICVDEETKLNGICTINEDGSNLIILRSTPNKLSSPFWSPDGNGIVYVEETDSYYQIYNIVAMNSDGSNPKELTSDLPEIYLSGFSSDGKYLAYSIQSGLFVFNISKLESTKISDDHPWQLIWFPYTTQSGEISNLKPQNTSTACESSNPIIDSKNRILIPAGEFQMGCDFLHPGGTACPEDSLPLHTVYLDAYTIDMTEVTNEKYAQCISAGMCKRLFLDETLTQYKANYPVRNINWYEADAFCKWAGGQLPTEAQWIKAARGSCDTRPYPWGEQLPDCTFANISVLVGEHLHSCIGDITEAGSYPLIASPYGALDMVGNVEEWVNDWYSETYYSISPKSNPFGADNGEVKVIMGGRYWDLYSESNIIYRRHYYPSMSKLDIGFRCVAEP